jgi:hypothetical protein|tara:strand:+ start:343 stop:477 length:135 start_codon:yes stop_codon:yes gene_type:complete
MIDFIEEFWDAMPSWVKATLISMAFGFTLILAINLFVGEEERNM